MILTGSEITKQVKLHKITINPFLQENITTNSYDLSLGKKYIKYTTNLLDPAKKAPYKLKEIPKNGIRLNKGDFILGHSNEVIGSKKFVPIIHARSGIARLGLFVHVTADLIDIGSIGNITFQLFATTPIILYPGMKIGQVSFWKPKGQITLYSGKYNGSEGPRASEIYKDFDKKRTLHFPEVINFKITNRCKHACKYCYASKDNVKELNINQLKKIFQILKIGGAKAIELTGGEPTARKDLSKIVKEIKKQGFSVYLDTAGESIIMNKDIANNVDVLGLPVDFVNNSYRTGNNFNTIKEILTYYKTKHNKPKIRIGTVVTKDNVHSLKQIGDFIAQYNVNLWKIYEFIPINKLALNFKNELEIDKNEFNKAVSDVQKHFKKRLKISVASAESRNKAYFFINPAGMVYIPVHEKPETPERYLGNIADNDIIEKWYSAVDYANYENNKNITFNMESVKNDSSK